MEAISFINGWVRYMYIIIPVSAGAMITYQALRKSLTDDEGTISEATNKIKQTIKGAIIGMALSGLIDTIHSFYL